MNVSARQRPLTGIRPSRFLLIAIALAACTPASGPSGAGGSAGSTGGTGGNGPPGPRGGSGAAPTGGAGGAGGANSGSGGSTGGALGAGGAGTAGGSGGSQPGTGGSGGSVVGTGGAGGAGGSGGAGSGGAGGTGGQGGTGGAGGSGSADGPAAETPSNPAGCTAKFCDDFEGFAAGGAPAGNWKPALAKGMLAVDESKAFSGAKSVRFTHNGAPANMFIELRQPVLPMAGNIVYGRMMYYLTKTPTGQYTHFELVRGGGVLSGTSRAQLNTGGENGKVVVNYEPGDCTKYSKVVLPEKKWTCYQFRFDGTKNDIHLWVDGVSVDDIPVAPAGGCWRHPMAVDTLHVGWESYHGSAPVELWIDDVAVGDQMIPCPTGPPSKP